MYVLTFTFCELLPSTKTPLSLTNFFFPKDVILSLVRTSRPGYLRDMRRMTVALSRARLGLYVLGRRSVFESCYDLNEAFSRLIASRRTKLELVVGEMWPTQREAGEESPEGTVVMEDVTHLGQYVYEMTVTAVERLKAGGSIAGASGAAIVEVPAEEAEEVQEDREGDAEGEDEGGDGEDEGGDGEGGAIAMEL